jgi:hypothetical protein
MMVAMMMVQAVCCAALSSSDIYQAQALASLQAMIDQARQKSVFLNITDIWSPQEQELFHTGIRYAIHQPAQALDVNSLSCLTHSLSFAD